MQKELDDLLKIQIAAEEEILRKIAKRIKKGLDTTYLDEQLTDTVTLRRELEMVLYKKDLKTSKMVTDLLLKSYGKASNRVLGKQLLTDRIPYHLQRLVMEANNNLNSTSVRILRNSMDVYRDVISDTSSGILTGVDTRLEAAQKALNQFASKGVTGFVDKLGRNWQLHSYTEMALRTSTARAALQGHIDSSLELGQDLMKVSGHSASCPICEPWANKILSITGKTPGFPTLESAKSAGLFHPNCKHTLTIYFPELDDNGIPVDNEEVKEPGELNPMYSAISKQRYIERKIREYKRLESVALDDVSKVKANNQVKKWQGVQRQHVEEWNLKRKYSRESIKVT